jgi:serine/threonine-protein phosphatase 2A regulatory subunit B''
MTAVAADLAARFVYILTAGARTHLMPADFEVMLQDIIDTFPGFDFLRASNAFHPRYIMTVTARIFWAVNRSWTGRITILEMRKSNFLKVSG